MDKVIAHANTLPLISYLNIPVTINNYYIQEIDILIAPWYPWALINHEKQTAKNFGIMRKFLIVSIRNKILL